MFELIPAQKAAYVTAREFPAPSMIADLCDLAQHATAAALSAEFWARHSPWKSACGEIKQTEFGSVMQACTRPEHEYQHVDWLRLADEKLREVKR
jgi:hypothetical protein